MTSNEPIMHDVLTHARVLTRLAGEMGTTLIDFIDRCQDQIRYHEWRGEIDLESVGKALGLDTVTWVTLAIVFGEIDMAEEEWGAAFGHFIVGPCDDPDCEVHGVEAIMEDIVTLADSLHLTGVQLIESVRHDGVGGELVFGIIRARRSSWLTSEELIAVLDELFAYAGTRDDVDMFNG